MRPFSLIVIGVFVLGLIWASLARAQAVPPHGALPTGAQCAQQISPSPETQPQNAAYNQTTPSASQLAPFYNNPFQFNGPPASDIFQVDGNYTGSTQQIIEWAACKWGIDPLMLKAQAWEESKWNQLVNGDMATTQAGCTGGNGYSGWQPSGNYCYTSFSLIQIKCVDYNACPMAQQSTSFAMDFRGAYFRACLNGDIPYYYGETPSAGYPTYPNGTAAQMADGCMGSWYSGNWYDSLALPYIKAIHMLMVSQPWVAPLTITSPVANATVNGKVSVAFAVNAPAPPACYYVCLDADTGHVGCTQPFSWDTTAHVPNGIHSLSVNAYTCGLASGNDQLIGWPTATILVDVENAATTPSPTP